VIDVCVPSEPFVCQIASCAPVQFFEDFNITCFAVLELCLLLELASRKQPFIPVRSRLSVKVDRVLL